MQDPNIVTEKTRKKYIRHLDIAKTCFHVHFFGDESNFQFLYQWVLIDYNEDWEDDRLDDDEMFQR